MKSNYAKPLKSRHMLCEIYEAILAHTKTGAPQFEPVTLHIWRTPIEDEYIIEICAADGTSEFIGVSSKERQ